MSYMFELYYQPPADVKRQTALAQRVALLGGRLTYREQGEKQGASVCLTFEFENSSSAERAAEELRADGAHVEGPMQYGVAIRS